MKKHFILIAVLLVIVFCLISCSSKFTSSGQPGPGLTLTTMEYNPVYATQEQKNAMGLAIIKNASGFPMLSQLFNINTLTKIEELRQTNITVPDYAAMILAPIATQRANYSKLFSALVAAAQNPNYVMNNTITTIQFNNYVRAGRIIYAKMIQRGDNSARIHEKFLNEFARIVLKKYPGNIARIPMSVFTIEGPSDKSTFTALFVR